MWKTILLSDVVLSMQPDANPKNGRNGEYLRAMASTLLNSVRITTKRTSHCWMHHLVIVVLLVCADSVWCKCCVLMLIIQDHSSGSFWHSSCIGWHLGIPGAAWGSVTRHQICDRVPMCDTTASSLQMYYTLSKGFASICIQHLLNAGTSFVSAVQKHVYTKLSLLDGLSFSLEMAFPTYVAQSIEALMEKRVLLRPPTWCHVAGNVPVGHTMFKRGWVN